jgi:hypothetical protein
MGGGWGGAKPLLGGDGGVGRPTSDGGGTTGGAGGVNRLRDGAGGCPKASAPDAGRSPPKADSASARPGSSRSRIARLNQRARRGVAFPIVAGVTPARRALPLLLVGGLPLAVGAVLPRPDPGGVDLGLACPFRAITGLPCPLCGSTRAVTLLAHADPGFARLNLVVPLLLVALLLAGAWLALGRSLPPVRGRALAVALAGCLAASWAWTVTHRDAIVT